MSQTKIRAKFIVDSRLEDKYGQANVSFSPVMNTSDENAKFYKATPGGKIELNFLKPEVAALFELGKEYYVEFVPVG